LHHFQSHSDLPESFGKMWLSCQPSAGTQGPDFASSALDPDLTRGSGMAARGADRKIALRVHH